MSVAYQRIILLIFAGKSASTICFDLRRINVLIILLARVSFADLLIESDILSEKNVVNDVLRKNWGSTNDRMLTSSFRLFCFKFIFHEYRLIAYNGCASDNESKVGFECH